MIWNLRLRTALLLTGLTSQKKGRSQIEVTGFVGFRGQTESVSERKS
jgi:hypothetical protein